jgi:hypothetical protein
MCSAPFTVPHVCYNNYRSIIAAPFFLALTTSTILAATIAKAVTKKTLAHETEAKYQPLE